jgi:hypothetical protein
MVQVPDSSRVTAAGDGPEAVQTNGVVEARLTVSPAALVVALTVNGSAPYVWGERVANEIVCGARVTATV